MYNEERMIKKEDCILVDIDNTVADLSKRLHYVKNGNRDWDSFFAEVKNDSPIWQVIRVVNHLYDAGERILLVSGRSGSTREDTIEWLEWNQVRYHELHMRGSGDTRKDTVIKQEIYDLLVSRGLNPWLAIDDRARIASVWRSNGILTFQCDDWEEREEAGKIGDLEATLYILVGPSGAGKTTWIKNNIDPALSYVISSDDLRMRICDGDFQDQTKNEQVFKAAHGMIRSLLLNECDVVFDATNIRNKDRKAVVNCAPKGVKVKYIVIDRPLEDKLESRNRRPAALIEKHHNTMQSNIKDILKGDNLQVEVEDLRDV